MINSFCSCCNHYIQVYFLFFFEIWVSLLSIHYIQFYFLFCNMGKPLSLHILHNIILQNFFALLTDMSDIFRVEV